MSEISSIHATLISVDGKGVLFTGKSGCGKSDMAFRMIEDKHANLVADDNVNLTINNGRIYGSSPNNLKGLLEVRGVGIVKYPYKQQETIDLIVKLTDDINKVERIPKKQQENILGLAIPQIALYAKESSAPEKVMLALRTLVVKRQLLEE